MAKEATDLLNSQGHEEEHVELGPESAELAEHEHEPSVERRVSIPLSDSDDEELNPDEEDNI